MVQPFAGQPPQAVALTAYPVTQPPKPKVNADGSISVDQSGSFTGSLTSVVVNITASGDATIYSGTPAQTISVYRMALLSTQSALFTATTVITVKSGAATALSGPMPLEEGIPFVLNFDGHPYYQTTNSTDALVINVNTTASVGGNIWLVRA